MGKFDGLLLASDFDDTFITHELVIPQANISALEYYIREGGIFTIATGRAHPTFSPYADIVPCNAPVILSNGSALFDFKTNRMVHETFLPDRVSRDLAQVVRDIPELGFEAYHDNDIYAFNPNSVTEAHIARAKAAYTEAPIDEIPLPWSKAILQQDNSVLQRVRNYMLERWSDQYEVIFSSSVLLELTRKGSNKGGMVRHLAELLQIRPEHIYCIGDNQNDIPMLDISHIPFAPGDCAREVKDWGARLLCPCGDGCIARVIGILDNLYH